MLLSIIIPNYNKKKYLEPLLAHLADQIEGRNDVEVIVVDDASTDNSWPIIQKFAAQFITLRNERNMYNSYTRNVGIDNATGEYITFIDSDDDVTQDFVEAILYNIKTGHDGYFFDYIINDVTGQGNVEKGWNTMVWSKVYKKSVIEANAIAFDVEHFPRGTLCEDYDFNLQFLAATQDIVMVDKPIIIYNWGVDGSVSNSPQTGGYKPRFQIGDEDYRKWFR